jgi:PAS domain S-box-containing protein
MSADTAQPVSLDWSAMLQAHPLAHFVYDPDTLALLRANDAALARYGYTHNEFLRLNRRDLLAAGQEPHLRAFLSALPASAQDAQQPVWLERTRTGELMYADVRGMDVLWQGRRARLASIMDAGPRTQLAAAAARSRDLLLVAGRMAHLGGWSLDLQAQRVYWSDEVCALHEVPPGTSCPLADALAFYAGPAAEQLRAAVTRCAADGTPFDLELPFVGARGTQRWVRAVGEPVRDAQGQVIVIHGAQQDITAHKQDALALAESRSRLAALLAAMPDLWLVLDADGRYAEVSDPEHPSLSHPWSQKVGRPLAETLPADMVRDAQALVLQAHSSAQPTVHRYQMDVARGEQLAFEARYVPLPEGRTLILVRDVTDTVRLEGRFRAMADAAPIAIYMTDPHGACTYTNAAWQAVYGLSGADSLGRGWARRVHPQDHARVMDELKQGAQSLSPMQLEFRLQMDDGSVRQVLATSRPIVPPGGALLGFVGTVADVTQARELQAARQAQAVAEEAGRRQTAFMSRVSHELRTPLNAILGFGQLLQVDLPAAQPRLAGYVDHVMRAGQHMLALVDDLLELQRIEQGLFEPVRAPVDLGALLEASRQMMQPMADGAGVTLTLDVPEGLLAHSDERGLKQVLLNLGSNAIKYAGPGSQVCLRARSVGQGTELCVADTGVGMTADQLQRLFRPFERLGQERGSVPGSGLGLVITQQLAKALGAELALHSQPGAGTTATLLLPSGAPAAST